MIARKFGSPALFFLVLETALPFALSLNPEAAQVQNSENGLGRGREKRASLIGQADTSPWAVGLTA